MSLPEVSSVSLSNQILPKTLANICCPLKIYRQHPLLCAVHSLCPAKHTLLLWMEGQGTGELIFMFQTNIINIV